MAQKILLADDSMTAQNMGKKILVEGGYEVVTVSNGAAAVRKIAEYKPDVIILDVYMPGYTGLEVCERLRKAPETATRPVLLTVGKMEPFKPEEGNKVRANGVLIKPFEATDLLAAVKKLAEKSQSGEPSQPAAAPPPPPPPPPAIKEFEATVPLGHPVQDFDKTIKLDHPILPDLSDASYEEWKSASAEPLLEEPEPAKIEVPQEMAVTPAFGDVLDSHPAMEFDAPPAELKNAAEFEAMEAVAAASASASPAVAPLPLQSAPAPVFDVEDFQLDEPAVAAPVVEEEVIVPEPAAPSEVAAEPVASGEPPTGLEATAAPAESVTVEPLADLEPTILQEAIPIEVEPDAALVTEPEELAQFTTKFGVENPEDIPVGIAAESPLAEVVAEPPVEAPLIEEPLPDLTAETGALELEPAPLEPEPVAEAAPVLEPEPIFEAPAAEIVAEEPVVESELEAEVVAVAPVEQMTSVIAEPQRVQEVLESVAEPVAAGEEAVLPEPEAVAPAIEEVLAPEPEAVAPAAEEVFEPQPEPIAVAEPAPAEPEPVAVVSDPEPPEPEPAMVAPEPEFVQPQPIVTELAAEHGIDEAVISQIVDRVIERLKSALVTSISEELKRK